jgi:hypothetical protein
MGHTEMQYLLLEHMVSAALQQSCEVREVLDLPVDLPHADLIEILTVVQASRQGAGIGDPRLRETGSGDQRVH